MRRLLMILLGTGLGVLAAELGLRIINAVFHPPIYALDDELGWRLAPSLDRTLTSPIGREIHFTTDERGVRIAGSAERGPASRRVLFVGDSFTQGTEVQSDELFTTLIERSLDDVEITNVGVGGYSTVQQLIAFDHWRTLVEPHLVVLAVYENDFADNLMPYFPGIGPRPYIVVSEAGARIVREPDPTAFEPFLQPAPARFWLYRHCAIYRSVHKNLFLPQHGESLSARDARARAALAPGDMQLAMTAALTQLLEAIEAAGSGLVIAFIPRREEAVAGQSRFSSWLAQRCGELGVPYLSLLETLHETPAEDAFFSDNIHFTRTGHDRAARVLLPFVKKHLPPN